MPESYLRKHTLVYRLPYISKLFLLVVALFILLAINAVPISAQDDYVVINAENISEGTLLNVVYQVNQEYYVRTNFSADSSILLRASGGRMSLVRVWDMDEFNLRTSWEADGLGEWAQEDWLDSVFPNSDGTFAITSGRVETEVEGSLQAIVTFHNLLTQEEQIFEIDRSRFPLALSSLDGSRFAHNRSEGIVIRDFNTGNIIADIDNDREDCESRPLSFSNNNQHLVYETRCNIREVNSLSSVWLWDEDNGSRILQDYIGYHTPDNFWDNTWYIYSSFSIEDDEVIVLRETFVQTWDVETATLLSEIELDLRAQGLLDEYVFAYDSQFNQFARLNREDNTLEVIDVETGQLLQTFLLDIEANSRYLRLYLNQNHLIARQTDELRMWDLENGELINDDDLGWILDVEFSQDNSLMFISDLARRVHVFSFPEGELIQTLSGNPEEPYDLVLSPDGTLLLVVTSRFLLWYGIPTESRPATTAIIANANDAYISLRAEPDFDAEIIDTIRGDVLITGIDESGFFVYLESHDGWVRSEPVYVDTFGVSLDQLPIIEP